eukprot:TRINITY_DN2039_c0_g1_i1.p1 TRINITY_DN2039_c0_g1~~TRINITY_DN2039_c0_g1_i1.p1  ORF type:complete len:394 (-),score=88.68 TRINITY_DN2039_c0_g1_i1:335-1516(-)
MPPVSVFEKVTAVPGMLVSGTASIVLSKVMFEMRSDGKKFEKPWYQTWIMFLGMMLCLLGPPLSVLFSGKDKKKEEAGDTGSIESGSTETAGEAKRLLDPTGDAPADDAFKLTMRESLKVMPPALCDLVATGLMMIGLLFIPASVFQLIRGSIIIFTAIESRIFLKRKIHGYQNFSLLLVIIALLCVGLASVMSDAGGSSQNDQLLGMFLVVGAQIIQATQTVIEEFLLKDVKAGPSTVVGLEGIWGSAWCTFVFLPILYFIPESSGVGEDTLNTFYLLGKNHWLIWMSLFSIAALLIFNQTGMMCTLLYSAVFRTILEGVRTLCIWMTDLFIYYFISKDFGESWTVWSWLQLGGFVILLLGTFIYDRVIDVPCFKYPKEAEDIKKEASVQSE